MSLQDDAARAARRKPWLIDLSRLASRAGQGPLTGIDRVERSYLRHLLDSGAQVQALVRVAAGFCLLDAAGAAALCDMAEGRAPPPPLARGLARLGRRAAWRVPDLTAARVETAIRALARATCLRPMLGAILARHVPSGAGYLNVGHSNLSDPVFAALRRVPGVRATVMVHDVIPLEHPQWARADTVSGFAARMRAVAAHADLVVCNSADTAARAAAVFARAGRVPPAMVAHLGLDPMPPAGPLPAGPDPARPWFLALGTIEPRKNHALLLDVWELLAARLPPGEMPQLVIAGRRGWRNAGLFARLDASPLRGHSLWELPQVDDPGRTALLAGARALVFPSLAEGFGLPLIEAMALGTPALCSRLAVFREFAGDYPQYMPVDAAADWAAAVAKLARHPSQRCVPPPLPDWLTHFNEVLIMA